MEELPAIADVIGKKAEACLRRELNDLIYNCPSHIFTDVANLLAAYGLEFDYIAQLI